jgi:RluA family pseudouridine synthase
LNRVRAIVHSPAALLTILAAGDGYVAVDKPSGRIVVPGRGRAAAEVTIRQDLERQMGQRLFVVHRLDRETSGVLLFATDEEAHRRLSQAFERHRVVKHYWALVQGSLLGGGDVALALLPVRGGVVRALRPGERGGKPSQTSWRALERVGAFTIVEFRPSTGRLHQLRAHVAAIGHPLAVDPEYGDVTILRVADLLRDAPAGSAARRMDQATVIADRVTLHASSLKFPHPVTGVSVVVQAPLPEDLTRAVEILRLISS